MVTTRSGRRRTQIVIVGLLLVAIVVGAVVVAHDRRETRRATRRVDASLERAGDDLERRIEQFRRENSDYPTTVRLLDQGVALSSSTGTGGGSVRLDKGVRLSWYSDRPDPRLSTPAQARGAGFSYCLTAHDRHWRLNRSPQFTTTEGPSAGPCPRAPER